MADLLSRQSSVQAFRAFLLLFSSSHYYYTTCKINHMNTEMNQEQLQRDKIKWGKTIICFCAFLLRRYFPVTLIIEYMV